MAGKSAVVRVAIVGDNSSLNRGLKDSQSKLAKFGKAIAAAGAVAAVAAGAALLKMADAAIEDQKAAAQLAKTLQTTTGATNDQVAAVEDWISKQGVLLGVTDDELRPALAKLATATGDIAEAQDLASIAMDTAAARGVSLESVTNALVRAQNGSLGGLSKLGIATKDAAGNALTLDQVTQKMADTFSGAAATAADTTAGKYQRMRLRLGEAAEEIGASLLPAITAVGDWLLDTGVPAIESFASAASAKLGPVVQDLTAWFGENGDELADLGGTLVDVLVPALEAAAKIAGAVLGVFSALPGPIKTLAVVVGVAAYAFKRLSPAVASARSGFTVASAKVKQLGAEMTYTELRAQRLEQTTSRLSGIGKSAAGIAAVAIGVGALADSIGRIDSENLDRSLEALGRGEVNSNIDQITTSLENLTATRNKVDLGEIVTLGGLAGDTTLDKYAANLKEVDAALAQMVEGGNGAEAARILAGIRTEAAQAGVSSDEVSKFFTEYRTAVDNAGSASESAIGPTAAFGASLQDSADAAKAEADALNDSIEAMREKRSEANSALNAELDYRDAIDEARAALKENGKTVDKSTEAGRNNLRTLYDLAGAWNDQSDAAKNAKGSLEGARAKFVETATAMGMSEGAAKRLADRLYEIPTKRRTDVQIDGIDGAISGAKTLRETLDALHSKDLTIAVHYQMLGNKPKAPIPGDPNSREAAVPQKSAAQLKAEAYNDGLKVGEGYLAGISAKAKGKSLLETLFSPSADQGSEAITAGIEAVATKIDQVTTKRIKDGKRADKVEKRILDHLHDQTKALRANGKAQDENNAKLDDAVNKVTTYSNAIRDSFVAFGDISQLGQTDTGKTTLPKLLRDLGKRAADAQEFNALLTQLANAGLDKTQIEQLTAAGPEQALATARAIASGGQFAIEEVNKFSRQITASGSDLGTKLADKFAISGTTSAYAYIDTLTTEQGTLDKTARHMARAYVTELEEQLAKVKPAQGKTPDNAGNQNDRVRVTLSSQQVSQLERGREIQVDLDAYHRAGGRSRG